MLENIKNKKDDQVVVWDKYPLSAEVRFAGTSKILVGIGDIKPIDAGSWKLEWKLYWKQPHKSTLLKKWTSDLKKSDIVNNEYAKENLEKHLAKVIIENCIEELKFAVLCEQLESFKKQRDE